MKLIEQCNKMDKAQLYDFYCRFVFAPKAYERITRKKMIEEIKEYYSPKIILEICTAKELKGLQEVIKGNRIQDRWTERTLEDKYLIFLEELVEDWGDAIQEALDHVDWEYQKRKDQFWAIAIGYLKAMTHSLLEPFYEYMFCHFKMEPQKFKYLLDTHPFSRFYTLYDEIYLESTGQMMPRYIYYYYVEDIFEMDEIRQEKAVGGTVYDPEVYESIFYHDYDATNKEVRTFFADMKKELGNEYPFFKHFLMDHVRFGNPIDEKTRIFPADIIHRANTILDSMPCPCFNGQSPKERREAIQKQTQYKRSAQRQGNARINEQETKLFYRIFTSLLKFTNETYQVKPYLILDPYQGLPASDVVYPIIQTFWDHCEEIVDAYTKKNPLKLSSKNLRYVQQFKEFERGVFFVVDYEEKYTVLMNDANTYMIKGLYDNIDDVLRGFELPCPVQCTILNFGKNIIYDGIMAPVPLRPDVQITEQLHIEKDQRIPFYTIEKNNYKS